MRAHILYHKLDLNLTQWVEKEKPISKSYTVKVVEIS